MSGSVRDTIGVAQPCVMRGPAPGNCSGSWRSPTGGTQANERARGPKAERVTTLSRSYSRKQIQRYKAAGQRGCMRILILGASGGCGRWATQLAVNAGHQITAFIRPTTPFQSPPGVVVQRGNALDPSDLERAV